MLTDAIFIPGSPLCASSYELQAKNKRQKKKKKLFPSGNVNSCSSGKEAALVVLVAWIQQLFCTGSAPRGSLKGEKGEGGKKEECAVNPVPCSG